MYTSDAAKLVPDKSIDWIYVDARHDYCGTTQDMEEWWPKLRQGGIMSGHDYMDGFTQHKYSRGPMDNWSICANGTVNEGAVKGAVDEFALKKGLSVSLTTHDGVSPSWSLSPKP